MHAIVAVFYGVGVTDRWRKRKLVPYLVQMNRMDKIRFDFGDNLVSTSRLGSRENFLNFHANEEYVL